MKKFNVNLQIEFPDEWDEVDINAFFLSTNPDMVYTIEYIYTFNMETRRGKGLRVEKT